MCPHQGEEPALAGEHGAGTVFLAGCSLRCAFCQNHQISHHPPRQHWSSSPRQLAEAFLGLERAGCCNIEWVSPTAHLPGLVEALGVARQEGCRLPVVYNSSGYERVEVLRLLEGIVDVYLPDAKYGRQDPVRALSNAVDYVDVNQRALLEMWRQKGPLCVDAGGLARQGLIIRHLVLPGHLENTRAVLGWIAGALGPEVHLSLMAQYYPAHLAHGKDLGPDLNRRLTRREHCLAMDALMDAGLENGWIQERASQQLFRPDFTQEDPFGGAATACQSRERP